jgi:hypothetical protein
MHDDADKVEALFANFKAGFKRSRHGNLWRDHEGRTVTILRRAGGFTWCIACDEAEVLDALPGLLYHAAQTCKVRQAEIQKSIDDINDWESGQYGRNSERDRSTKS